MRGDGLLCKHYIFLYFFIEIGTEKAYAKCLNKTSVKPFYFFLSPFKNFVF